MDIPKMRRLVTSCVAICALMLPALVHAQDTSIAGKVMDASGAVLPGVTVEAASPALIERVRTVTTDEQGNYRFIDLRPGSYTVTFGLTGFATVRRDGIVLNGGVTASINAEMRVGSLEETITVSGQAPLVDTSTTAARKTITKDTIDVLPTGKNWNGIGQVTVGIVSNQVDVGGSSGEQQNQVSIHGGSYTDNVRTMDGMMLSNFACNYSCTGLSSNDSSTQELAYDVGALSAEVAGGGVRINIIGKDGGNTLTGNAFGSYARHSWQANNLDDNLRSRGITSVDALNKLYDSSVGLGGPLRKDTLWFWVSQKYWGTELLRANDYWAKDPFAPIYTPDLNRQAVDDQWNESLDLRLTSQLSPRNKLSAYGNWAPRQTSHWNTTSLRTPEASQLQRIKLNHFETLVFRSAISNKMLFEAGVGNMTEDWTREPIPDGPGSLGYSVTELSSGVNYRAYDNAYSHNITRVSSFRSSVAYVTGSHSFKFGWQMQNGSNVVPQWHAPTNQPAGELGNVGLNLRNGVPTSVTVWTTPYTELENMNADLGLYAQDTWRLGRLTANLAIRYDWLNVTIPAQDAPATTWVGARHYDEITNIPNWKDIGPRVGASYDLFGDGRTAVKATVSRYVTTNTINYARANNPLFTSINSTTRPWTDANGDFIPQIGELGPLANRNFGTVRPSTIYDPSLNAGWRVRPGNWEYSAGIQHELLPGLGVDAAWFHRSYFNNYALVNEALSPSDFTTYCVTAPADSRLPGGISGSQVCGLYDVNPLAQGNVFTHAYDFDKYGKQSQTYNGIDVQATARLRNGAFIQGGFSTGHLTYDFCDGDYVGSVSTVSLPQGGGVATTQTLNFPDHRFCSTNYPYQTQAKLSAAYTIKYDVQLSGTFQSYPGPQILANWVAPASVATTNGGTLGRPLSGGVSSVTIPLIPPGTLYGDRRNQTDIRIARNFKINGKRLQVLWDLYNVMNSNSVVNQNNTYGGRWQEPTNIVIGRFFKLGAQFNF
jgi:hypothetical protein